MDVDGAEAAGQGSKSKGKEKDPSEFPSGTAPESNERPSIPTGLFARLQSRMPPNLQPSAIASAFSAASASLTADPNSARSPSSGPTAPVVDLAALRSTLISNIQRAQDNLPLAQAEKLAEGYLAKSQELFKEAGDFFKEAVKVVPPSERELDSGATGVFVSGTDVWLFPSPLGTAGWGGSSEAAASPVAGTDTPQSRPSLSAGTAAFTGHMSQATRSEALLRRLKYDPEMIRLDPSLDAAISSLYSEFVEDISQNMGGIGGDKMTMRISEVLKPGAGGELDADAKALIDTRDTLVPAEMSNDTFWLRYFFRVRQITSEEEKRKALLASKFIFVLGQEYLF
ncbi:hypothetical protein DL93DRAFT_2071853 [Clavulina sp. PMI_390]|nr:hypothetical protein DL93DRAFT_2071853 [Clavulina sp. PMI_390]